MTIPSLRVRPVLFVVTLGMLLSSATAGAAEGGGSDADEARAYHEKAKAAFALSHYGQAAEFFEKAFELKSDPALLYNAAQSHRLAGNKERALTLYQNYLHVYGRDERRPQIEMRIEELKKAIERDRKEIPAKPPAGWPPGTAPPPSASSSPGGSNPPAAANAAGGSLKPAPPSPPPVANRAPVPAAPPTTAPPPVVVASNTPSSALPMAAAPPPSTPPAALLTQPASS